jgi:hypothetical protein
VKFDVPTPSHKKILDSKDENNGDGQFFREGQKMNVQSKQKSKQMFLLFFMIS